MLETVNDVIANKKTALEQVQMLAPLQYVFTLKNVPSAAQEVN
jgi:hypothetical protein